MLSSLKMEIDHEGFVRQWRFRRFLQPITRKTLGPSVLLPRPRLSSMTRCDHHHSFCDILIASPSTSHQQTFEHNPTRQESGTKPVAVDYALPAAGAHAVHRAQGRLQTRRAWYVDQRQQEAAPASQQRATTQETCKRATHCSVATCIRIRASAASTR